jgi:hypothetical protein
MTARRFAALAILTLPLAACARTGADRALLENPLYAEWYYQDVVDHVVDLELADDASLKDADAKAKADAARKDALEKSNAAEARQDAGAKGTFVEVAEPNAGEALLLEGTLYISPDFQTAPGVDLHMYLSPAQDPREAAFPGPDDIDIGPVADPYGPHAYELGGKQLPDVRSAVLWDNALKRMHGFAQLRRVAQ